MIPAVRCPFSMGSTLGSLLAFACKSSKRLINARFSGASMSLICGIDEAGRGPVIGPLVICAVAVDERDLPKLQSLGVKDSKMLTPPARRRLAPLIKGVVKRHELVIVSPAEIDSAVLSGTMNLNWLEAVKSAELINRINPKKVILDCPSTNTRAYVAYLRKHLKNDVEVVAEHKADVKYPVVSAASIIAKVARDAEIENLKGRFGVDFGSGYPSDPVTADFVKKNFSKFPFFRRSWMTFEQASGVKKQKTLGDFH